MGLRAFAMAIAAVAAPAQAEIIVACTFPTLPSAVMRFPDGSDGKKMLEIGGRPGVELVEGAGTGRMISGLVDGYDFRFAPANSVMDVEKGGQPVLSETGKCVTIGGPANDTPLAIASTPKAAPEAEAPDEAQTEAVSEKPGKWVVTEDKSAFDDSRTVVLSLESEEPIRGQFGAPGPAVLHLRCMENTTVAYLWLNDLFLSDLQGYGVVDYRIDQRKASTIRTEGSTDNKALGLWSGNKSIPFIKEMLDGKSIAFRATPFNESPVEFTFDLTGLDVAVKPLREACAW